MFRYQEWYIIAILVFYDRIGYNKCTKKNPIPGLGEVPKLVEGTPLLREQGANHAARVRIPPSPPQYEGFFLDFKRKTLHFALPFMCKLRCFFLLGSNVGATGSSSYSSHTMKYRVWITLTRDERQAYFDWYKANRLKQ